ncbi:hypothetical protein MKW92_019564 [Papaver armeniacum]|nr:hypothetical protein MKW92_019564 [Papaver armeniacum]
MKLPKRIILVPHGESEGNTDGSAYTTTPANLVPLTEVGQDQARIADTDGDDNEKNWKVYFYVSPFLRTRQTLRQLGRAFEKKRIIGVRQECRVREQDWGNFQVEKEMRVIQETRLKYGRFFFRFPEENPLLMFMIVLKVRFLESLWRDIHNNRLQQHESDDDEINLVIVTHVCAARVFLMKWFGWTVEQFEYINNFEYGEIVTMELGSGGEYSLAVHHTDEEFERWGLSPEMVSDQKWRLTAKKGEWNEKCSWYLDGFFDHLQHSSDDDDNENENGDEIINNKEQSA